MSVIHGIQTNREKAWAIICAAAARSATVSRRDLEEAGIAPRTASDILGRFRRAGLIEAAGGTAQGLRGRPVRLYRLRAGVPAAGRVPEAVSRRGADWRREAWTTMRVKRHFTVSEVMRCFSDRVGVSRQSVHRFCVELVRGGYLRQCGRDEGGFYRFRLVRDTGPTPPPRQALLEEGNVICNTNGSTT